MLELSDAEGKAGSLAIALIQGGQHFCEGPDSKEITFHSHVISTAAV